MPRNTSTNTDTEIALPITRPIYLLELGFATPVRLSSRETMTFDSNSYTEVQGMQVNYTPPEPTIKFMNEGLAYTSDMIAQGASGISATLYVLYGDGAPYASSDADTYHDGEIGGIEITDESITLKLIQVRPILSPKFLATSDIFNFLPAEGTEILTPAGVYVITGE